MKFTIPDHNIAEVNHCHGTGTKGHPCDGGEALPPAEAKARWLAGENGAQLGNADRGDSDQGPEGKVAQQAFAQDPSLNFVVTLRKSRSTWLWTSHYRQGGSFGSSYAGVSRKFIINHATEGLKPGSKTAIFDMTREGAPKRLADVITRRRHDIYGPNADREL